MSFAGHGNWCGPGWSAGQWKNAKDLTEEDKQVEAVDALDQACKNHDIAIAEGDTDANEKFVEEAGALGIKGAAFAALVSRFGPSSQSILQNQKQMARLRTSKKNAENREQIRPYQKRTSGAEAQVKEALQNDAVAGDVTGLSFVESVNEAFDEEEKEEAENAETIEALIELNGDFVTPNRPTMRAAPTLTRGERQPLSNLLDQVDNDMDANNDQQVAPLAQRTATQGNQSDGNVSTNKQVMPMYNTPREMGFWTETRTAILPLSIYFSINKLDHISPVVLRFVVNDTYNIFRDTNVEIQTFPVASTNGHLPAQSTAVVPTNAGTVTHTLTTNHQPAYYSIPVARSKGISTDLAYSSLQIKANGVKYHKPVGMNYSRAIQFPTTTRCSVAGTATTTNGGKFGYSRGDNSNSANGDYPMAWRPYYEKVYRNRHVMQCDWQLTIENAVEGSFHRGVALETMECVTTQTVATPTTPIDKDLARMQRFKHIKKHQLACRNAQGGKIANILKGSWSPNAHIRRDVVDEENTKTWYATKNQNGPAPADWKEYAQYLFYNDEMSDNQNCYFNCRLDMTYTVQYRDLIDTLRFPDPTSATTILQIRDGHIPDGVYDESSTSTVWPRNDEVQNYEESLELADSHHFIP